MPHNTANIFSSQSKGFITPPRSVVPNAQRTRGVVVQDKPHPTSGPTGTRQPGPEAFGQRAGHFAGENEPISSSVHRPARRAKKQKVSSWMRPVVVEHLQRRAAQTGLSVSVLVATMVEHEMHRSIEEQYVTELEPLIRKIMREEFQTFGNRIVHFLMIIGYAAEQARILIINVVERVLLLLKVPDVDGTLTSLRDRSSDLARKNVIEGMPPIKTLEEEWWKRTTEGEEERKARP